jgi:hypothetical protein
MDGWMEYREGHCRHIINTFFKEMEDKVIKIPNNCTDILYISIHI